MRTIVAAIVGFASLANPNDAHAADAPAVQIRGERPAVDASKLDALVALELGADAPRVTIDLGGGRADVEVKVGDDVRRGSVAVAATEPERALALFVAELARGAAPEPAPEPAPAPAPAPPAAPPPPPPPPPRDAAPAPHAGGAFRLSVLGTMGARLLTDGVAWLPTPRIEVGVRDDRLRLGALARYAFASAEDPLGTVRAHAVAGGAAGTYVLASSSVLALATGPRVELGAAFGEGDGKNAGSTTAFTFTATWEIELALTLGAIAPVLTLEAGSTVRGLDLRADDRDVLRLSGALVGASLGALL